MKIIVAPGAFKHSLSAQAAAAAIVRGLGASGLGADVQVLPIADGGNGTLDAFLANGGRRIPVYAHDPLMRPVAAAIGLLADGETAVIEMALASGLELLRDDERDPLRASTYGTGELLQAALDAGASRVIVGMGGSATVDGGSGALRALGLRLLDAAGAEVPHGGGHLTSVATMDASNLDPRWQNTDVIIASDVDNPTLGEQGAAAVFGPQKGASPADVVTLEANLSHFFALIAQQHGQDVRGLAGGGAAGALAAGLLAFIGGANGRVTPGIDLLLAYNGFAQHLADADLVITGEGQMDEQTIHGKGPIGVARLAAQHGVPTVALVGGLRVQDTLLREAGLHAVLPIVDYPMPLAEALARADELVERAALRLGAILRVRN